MAVVDLTEEELYALRQRKAELEQQRAELDQRKAELEQQRRDISVEIEAASYELELSNTRIDDIVAELTTRPEIVVRSSADKAFVLGLGLNVHVRIMEETPGLTNVEYNEPRMNGVQLVSGTTTTVLQEEATHHALQEATQLPAAAAAAAGGESGSERHG